MVAAGRCHQPARPSDRHEGPEVVSGGHRQGLRDERVGLVEPAGLRQEGREQGRDGRVESRLTHAVEERLGLAHLRFRLGLAAEPPQALGSVLVVDDLLLRVPELGPPMVRALGRGVEPLAVAGHREESRGEGVASDAALHAVARDLAHPLHEPEPVVDRRRAEIRLRHEPDRHESSIEAR